MGHNIQAFLKLSNFNYSAKVEKSDTIKTTKNTCTGEQAASLLNAVRENRQVWRTWSPE